MTNSSPHKQANTPCLVLFIVSSPCTLVFIFSYPYVLNQIMILIIDKNSQYKYSQIKTSSLDLSLLAGLACYLLGIETPQQLERDPAFGGLFENLVIAEAYKSRINAGLEPGLYFYRDRYQHEVDLLYPSGSSFLPVEIKSSRIYRSEFLKGIRYFQKLSGSEQPGLLIYDGELDMDKEDAAIRNFRNVWR
ncbi:MAG: DUF4143 domain-containing protein [Candidatus Electrothrix sp. MAN1_4]|nr:DUF4143 domain-containing protein [Candidatus Electrothrix sp. MAN1_4]